MRWNVKGSDILLKPIIREPGLYWENGRPVYDHGRPLPPEHVHWLDDARDARERHMNGRMRERVAFFDSNILVADALEEHVHHRASRALLDSLSHGGGACAAHTLAETYNTLTRPKPGYNVPCNFAADIIHNARDKFLMVTLTAEEVAQTIQNAAEANLAGPLVYDAILLACARKVQPIAIYTYNLGHFNRIAPDLANIIREP